VLAIWDLGTDYRILGLIHVLAVILAFGPLFLYPSMQRSGDTQAMARMHMRLVFPSLVVVWVAGMGMAGVGEYDLAANEWVMVSILLWLVMLVISWFLIRPATKDTSEDARKKMAIGSGITHLLLIVTLVLMIWKPGAGPGGAPILK
jgi:cytochrome bd-type quinol oxidase subunit 2